MSLKAKVMLSLVCLFVLYGVLDYSIQRFIVMPEFAALEKNQALDNLQRTIHTIQGEVDHLSATCHDWSSWDDTYKFVQDPGEDYVKSNLEDESFKSIGVNLMYLCTTRGKVVWGRIVDFKTGAEIRVPELPLDSLPPDHPLLQLNPSETDISKSAVSGVLVTGMGPMLVTSRPILRSNNIGPVAGVFIMGKFLDQTFVHRLEEQTRVSFTISQDPAEKAALRMTEDRAVGGDFPYHIDFRDKGYLAITATYPDIMGGPAFVIRTTLARDIMKGGSQAMLYTLATLAAAGLAVALLIMLFLDRTLLHPVTDLTRHVLSISETGNFSLRLRVNRKDEIGTLAREFDRMLGKIEEMNAMMEHINDQLIDDIQKKHEMERKLQAANCQLETLASEDGLTRLSNRRKFDECIEVEWRRGIRDGDPLSLIILDVDFFKSYNDTYGHQAGDDCLRAVAEAIRSNTRRAPDLAARYGGEEFAVILPATDIDGALHLAEIIRDQVNGLSMLHDASGTDTCVTVSAGVACVVPSKGSTFDDLVRMADSALYEAKAAGRNRCVACREKEGLHLIR
jgi:diguanylate cyclase (GGDEF)-like protein